jgi:hypothetical protein
LNQPQSSSIDTCAYISYIHQHDQQPIHPTLTRYPIPKSHHPNKHVIRQYNPYQWAFTKIPLSAGTAPD